MQIRKTRSTIFSGRHQDIYHQELSGSIESFKDFVALIVRFLKHTQFNSINGWGRFLEINPNPKSSVQILIQVENYRKKKGPGISKQ